MGGPSKSAEQNQNAAAQAQASAATQFGQLSQQQINSANALYAPVIAHDQGLVSAANSGNYSGLVNAAGPTIGTIGQQDQQAKAQIMQGPAGPGRDAALAQLPQQQANQTSQALNQSYQGALGQLQQLGGTFLGSGQQFAGAQLSGLQGAANTYGQVSQAQAAGKASTDSLLGSVAGGLGSAAGGFF